MDESNGVPAELTSFVGRTAELRAGAAQLKQARLLTLVGPGGVGKTRLAGRLAGAAGQAGAKTHVRWCTLTGVHQGADGTAVERAVAESLGIEIVSERSTRRMIVAHLAELERSGPVVLVLDNCEHVVSTVGALVSAVLAAGGKVRILATSRAALGCAGEELFDVPPLSTAGADSEALELFRERAKAVGVTVQASEQGAATQLCGRLDGLPLALELAAAGLRSQSVSEILSRLDGSDRFRMLTGGPRHGAHPMHHSIHAAVEWSYRLCSETEQALWARLSVFEDGWDLAAAEAVGAGPDLSPYDVLGALTELVGKSIVTADRSNGTTRYRMLETLRQYGYAQLSDPAEQHRRHRDHFLAVTRQAATDWFSPRELTYLQQCHTELANLRAARNWSRSTPGQAPAGLELAVSLARLRLQFYLGNSGELIGWLQDGLPAADSAEQRLWAATMAGVTALVRGDRDSAAMMLEVNRSGPVFEDPVGAGLTGLLEGLYAFFVEGQPESIAVLRDAADAFEKSGPEYRGEQTMALLFAGMAANWYGTDAETHELVELYSDNAAAAGAEFALVWTLVICGLAVSWPVDPTGPPPEMPPPVQAGDHWGLMYILQLVAWAGAASIRHRTIPAPQADRTDALRIARSLGGARRLRERYGVAISALPPFRDADGDAEATATAVLGRGTFADTFSAARALAFDDIAALSLSDEPPEQMPDSVEVASAWAVLTVAEQEVARLAAEGLSDAEIARRRVCSVRTVEKHLENVRRKLMVDSRRGIARWVPEG